MNEKEFLEKWPNMNKTARGILMRMKRFYPEPHIRAYIMKNLKGPIKYKYQIFNDLIKFKLVKHVGEGKYVIEENILKLLPKRL